MPARACFSWGQWRERFSRQILSDSPTTPRTILSPFSIFHFLLSTFHFPFSIRPPGEVLSSIQKKQHSKNKISYQSHWWRQRPQRPPGGGGPIRPRRSGRTTVEVLLLLPHPPTSRNPNHNPNPNPTACISTDQVRGPSTWTRHWRRCATSDARVGRQLDWTQTEEQVSGKAGAKFLLSI